MSLGRRLEELELVRRTAIAKADAALPEIAQTICRLMDMQPEQQTRELGTTLESFIPTLKDPKGKPRNMIWAQTIAGQWRHIRGFKVLADACLAGACTLRSAYFASVIAEKGDYFGAALPCVGGSGEERKLLAREEAGNRALALACQPYSVLEGLWRGMQEDHRPTVRMGGMVLPATKFRWHDAWNWVAKMTDRPIPKRPAFEWQVETVLDFLEDVRDAAQRDSGRHEPGGVLPARVDASPRDGVGATAGGEGDVFPADEEIGR